MLPSPYVRGSSPAPGARRGRDLLRYCEEPLGGSVSLGYGPDGKRIRRKVVGRTKQEVRDRLKALHQELEAGLKSPSSYTVRERSTTGCARG